MTSETNDQSFGAMPPMPTVEITMEQQFKLVQIKQELHKAEKDNIIDLFSELQRHAYVLQNNITHLIKNWPT